MIERVAVSPDTVTVLGNRVKATDAAWAGLDLDKAEPRTQNTLALACFGADQAATDIHLSVPWDHPEDRAAGRKSGCIYRVRPKMQPGRKWRGKMVAAVAFERWQGKWFVAIEYKSTKAA